MLHVMVLQAKIACDMTFQATLVKLYVVEDLSQPVERRLYPVQWWLMIKYTMHVWCQMTAVAGRTWTTNT
jgi:multisubunit Na+/H+ antiporter MnhE subunit